MGLLFLPIVRSLDIGLAGQARRMMLLYPTTVTTTLYTLLLLTVRNDRAVNQAPLRWLESRSRVIEMSHVIVAGNARVLLQLIASSTLRVR